MKKFSCGECEKPKQNNPKMIKDEESFLSGHKYNKSKEDKDLDANEFADKFKEKLNQKSKR